MKVADVDDLARLMRNLISTDCYSIMDIEQGKLGLTHNDGKYQFAYYSSNGDAYYLFERDEPEWNWVFGVFCNYTMLYEFLLNDVLPTLKDVEPEVTELLKAVYFLNSIIRIECASGEIYPCDNIDYFKERSEKLDKSGQKVRDKRD
jgi:hypothetical protein